jgi:probable selenium-dependent hydroxylase accessory protein YqeC
LGTQDKNKSMAEALNAMQDDVIAFVGAGGKTALMLKLANELFKSGFRVVITTTTKLGISERPEQSEMVVERDANKLISELHTVQKQKKIPVLASGLDEENKRLVGISPTTAGRVASDIDVDCLLIEADGAQGKKFKIPMAHEPVVPECVNKLCIVLGLDALGKRINEENCYNIEGMAAFGVNPDEVLTPYFWS